MANEIRIIAGKWRGRKIQFPTVEGLRPTPNRIRETLFNWLAPYIHEARCLDLFTGSGALGFESLSRGAAYVLCLEKDREAYQMLRINAERLNDGNTGKRCADLANRAASAAFQTKHTFRYHLC